MDNSITQSTFIDNNASSAKKVCKECNKPKDINEFRERRNTCKECNKGKNITRLCKGCRKRISKEDAITIGTRTSYCPTCWEEVKGKKICMGCRKPKDLDEFAGDQSRPDKLEYYCKDCRRERQPSKHRRELLKRGKKKCISCKKEKDIDEFADNYKTRDHIDVYCIECRTNPKPELDTTREHVTELKLTRRFVAKLRSIYNITEDDYRNLFAQQRGLCNICGRPEIKRRRGLLCVDHNHKTDQVRALLCNACNTGLGMFEDSIDYLHKAIEYLKQHK